MQPVQQDSVEHLPAVLYTSVPSVGATFPLLEELDEVAFLSLCWHLLFSALIEEGAMQFHALSIASLHYCLCRDAVRSCRLAIFHLLDGVSNLLLHWVD